MTAAINQGVELSTFRSSAKTLKAIDVLADKVAAKADATPARRWR